MSVMIVMSTVLRRHHFVHKSKKRSQPISSSRWPCPISRAPNKSGQVDLRLNGKVHDVIRKTAQARDIVVVGFSIPALQP